MIMQARYHDRMKVNIGEPRRNLTELIKQVESGGESVTICRRGVPVADLIRTTKSSEKRPRFGTLRGKIIINDPHWWKPMTGKEVQAFLSDKS
jgi:prevent-host-death family protein